MASGITGLAEQHDGGRGVTVEAEGAHVQLSVETTDGRFGVVLLTPAQARKVAAFLEQYAREAETGE